MVMKEVEPEQPKRPAHTDRWNPVTTIKKQPVEPPTEEQFNQISEVLELASSDTQFKIKAMNAIRFILTPVAAGEGD